MLPSLGKLPFSNIQADLVAQEAQDAARQYFSNSPMSIPAQMIIVTGRKP
jgi:hypothetical protein